MPALFLRTWMKSLGGLIEIAVWHFGAARRVLHSAERKKKKREMGESLTDLVNDIWRLFRLVYSIQCNTMADVIAKDAFIDALGDKELTIRTIEREPKSLESLQDCRKIELYARKVKPESKGWVRIQAGPGRSWLLVPGLLWICDSKSRLLPVNTRSPGNVVYLQALNSVNWRKEELQ